MAGAAAAQERMLANTVDLPSLSAGHRQFIMDAAVGEDHEVEPGDMARDHLANIRAIQGRMSGAAR